MKKLLLIIPAILLLTGCANTGTGTHNGYITNTEKTGLIWKTGTVYIKTDLSSSQEDFYCVENQDVMNKLQEYKDKGIKVKLNWHDEMIIAPWRCGQSECTGSGDNQKCVEEQAIVDSVEEN